MRFDYPHLALGAFALVVAVALVFAGSTSATAFGTYNPGWEGTSALQDLADDPGTEREVLRDASDYRDVEPEGTVAFVLSPSEPYDDASARAVRGFVEDGGTLLVADDFGEHGNGLLADLDANASVDGGPVRDERRYADGPVMPVAPNASDHALARGVDGLALNHGSVVRAEGNVTTLAATSPFAYLDENGNDALDQSETLASRPVATIESVGEGRVIVVSDPSVFINAMLTYEDNERFARNVLAAHDRVVFDVSHLGAVPPLRLATLTLRESPLAQLSLGFAGIAAVAGRGLVRRGVSAAVARVRRRRPVDPAVEVDPEAVARRLRRRHPDWDADRVDRITQGVLEQRREVTRDE